MTPVPPEQEGSRSVQVTAHALESGVRRCSRLVGDADARGSHSLEALEADAADAVYTLFTYPLWPWHGAPRFELADNTPSPHLLYAVFVLTRSTAILRPELTVVCLLIPQGHCSGGFCHSTRSPTPTPMAC